MYYCSSLCNAYKSKLNDHASFVATCAAITDYMEDRPLGSKLLQIYDRQFALISATVMTYNIVGHQREPDYLQYLVEELSDSKFPHDIPNTFEFAQIQVEKLSQMIAKVKKGMKTMTNLGSYGNIRFWCKWCSKFCYGFIWKRCWCCIQRKN